ncbi:unnamed protein product, partial [Boreogadus saida]
MGSGWHAGTRAVEVKKNGDEPHLAVPRHVWLLGCRPRLWGIALLVIACGMQKYNFLSPSKTSQN